MIYTGETRQIATRIHPSILAPLGTQDQPAIPANCTELGHRQTQGYLTSVQKYTTLTTVRTVTGTSLQFQYTGRGAEE